MALGAIEFTTISRAQEYTAIKQNEDNKGFVDQANISQYVQKEQKHRTNQVNSQDETNWHTRQFDAKEKGDNEYEGNGVRKRQKKETHEQVVVKTHKGFDMKI